jgi:hypothetical protein
VTLPTRMCSMQLWSQAAAAFESQLVLVAAKNGAGTRGDHESRRSRSPQPFWEANRRLPRESRRVQAMRLVRGRELPTSFPEPDAEAVEIAVRRGLTLSEVLKALAAPRPRSLGRSASALLTAGAPPTSRTCAASTCPAAGAPLGPRGRADLPTSPPPGEARLTLGLISNSPARAGPRRVRPGDP